MDFSLILDETYESLTDDFARIEYIQKQLSSRFPFENIDVLQEERDLLTEEFMFDKFIVRRRGGLCYELNALLYMILRNEGFDVSIGAGTVWAGEDWAFEGTHVMVLWHTENGVYVVDSGYGINLALAPLAIDGEAMTSPAGSFRVRAEATERGEYIYENYTKGKWTRGYAFTLDPVAWEDFERIRQVITYDEASHFRKGLLLAKIHGEEVISITEKRLKITSKDGVETEHPFVDKAQVAEALTTYGSEEIARAYLQI